MIQRNTVSVLAIVFASGCSVTPSWKFHSNNANNGLGVAGGTNSGTVQWTFSTGGPVTGGPSVGPDEKTIYFGSDDGNVYAVSSGGTQVWKTPTQGRVRSTPAVSNGVVYVGSDDGSLYALDAASGRVNWTFPTGGPVESSPAVSNTVLYVGSNDKNVYALDITKATADNGGCSTDPNAGKRCKWQHTTGDLVTSSPAIDPNGNVYIGSQDGKLYELDPGDGHALHSVDTGFTVYASPALSSSGAVYLGSKTFMKFDSNLNVIWSADLGAGNFSTAAVLLNGNQETVYIGTDFGLFALDGTTHNVNWSQTDVEPDLVTSPSVIPNGLVFWGDNGAFLAASAAAGKPTWSVFSAAGGGFGSVCALATNGTVYTGSFDGKLYAIH